MTLQSNTCFLIFKVKSSLFEMNNMLSTLFFFFFPISGYCYPNSWVILLAYVDFLYLAYRICLCTTRIFYPLKNLILYAVLFFFFFFLMTVFFFLFIERKDSFQQLQNKVLTSLNTTSIQKVTQGLTRQISPPVLGNAHNWICLPSLLASPTLSSLL